MDKAIEQIENEVARMKNMIEHYRSKGDPTIEVLQPNPFIKLEELQIALDIVKKYAPSSPGACDLTNINILEFMQSR